MTHEVTFDADSAEATSTEDGDVGIVVLTVTDQTLVEKYNLDHAPVGDALVVPVKRNIDGAVLYERYYEEDGDITIVHTDEQYAKMRKRLDVLL